MSQVPATRPPRSAARRKERTSMAGLSGLAPTPSVTTRNRMCAKCLKTLDLLARPILALTIIASAIIFSATKGEIHGDLRPGHLRLPHRSGTPDGPRARSAHRRGRRGAGPLRPQDPGLPGAG